MPEGDLEIDGLEAPRQFNVWHDDGLIFVQTNNAPPFKIQPGCHMEVELLDESVVPPTILSTFTIVNGVVPKPKPSLRDRAKLAYSALKGE